MIHLSYSDDNEGDISNQLRAKVIEFNQQHFEVKQRFPIAISAHNEQDELMAGVSGHTFGHWLMIEWLWVDCALRGQQLGSRLLQAIEKQATVKGCNKVMVDTLEFQAPYFYQKHGYQEAFHYDGYPTNGKRYYFFKPLDEVSR